MYFLKAKSDATEALEKFLCDVAPYGKVNYVISKFRSDNGGEYIAQQFEMSFDNDKKAKNDNKENYKNQVEEKKTSDESESSERNEDEETPLLQPDIITEKLDVHENKSTPRSTRQRKKPEHLRDYITTIYSCYTTMSDEPKSYKQAIESEEADEWQKAMINEMESMRENEVFTVVPKPEGKKLVGCRWVYTIKSNPNGETTFKARFVTNGYSQKEGID